MRSSNTCIIQVPIRQKRERENGIETKLEGLMAENIPKQKKDIKPQILEIQLG
jgi:hypothetical protein